MATRGLDAKTQGEEEHTPDTISFWLGVWAGALGVVMFAALIVFLKGPHP